MNDLHKREIHFRGNKLDLSVCINNTTIQNERFSQISYSISLHFYFCISILVIAVLGGEVAVPCNSQSALARLNS